MPEKNDARRRIEEDFKPTFPDDDIVCKDCIFRKPDYKDQNGNVILKGCTHGYCEVYAEKISNGKPTGILFRHEKCKYYMKEDE